jgi:hypothetical protein
MQISDAQWRRDFTTNARVSIDALDLANWGDIATETD